VSDISERFPVFYVAIPALACGIIVVSVTLRFGVGRGGEGEGRVARGDWRARLSGPLRAAPGRRYCGMQPPVAWRTNPD
jgi:hypothetical protein